MTIKEAQLILCCTNILDIMYCVSQKIIPESYIKSNAEDDDGDSYFDLPTLQKEATKVLLEEFEKQEKIIDKMADYIAKREIEINTTSIQIKELWNEVTPEKPIWDLVKDYFYKEVENE